jgi:hypothetical protein
MTRWLAAVVVLLEVLVVVWPPPFAGALVSAPPVRIAYVTGSATTRPKVWIENAAGTGRRRLGRGSRPLLAPDGALVAASTEPGLVVYGVAGGPPHRYFNESDVTAVAVAFSPDSQFVAVVLSSTDPVSAAGSGLAVIDTTTFAARILVRGQIYGASFAPDGSDRIAYAAAGSPALSARVDVYEVGADGFGEVRLTRDGRSLNPVWGPGGIAFDHERLRSSAEPAYQVWAMTSDGRARRPVTSLRIPALREGLVPIAFAGGGGLLLAEYVGQDTSQAWLVRISSGHASALGAGLVGAGVSRDGTHALVVRGGFLNPPNHGVVETVPLTGGRTRMLIAHGSEPSWNA